MHKRVSILWVCGYILFQEGNENHKRRRNMKVRNIIGLYVGQDLPHKSCMTARDFGRKTIRWILTRWRTGTRSNGHWRKTWTSWNPSSKPRKRLYLLQRSIQDEQDLLELNAAKEKMVQNQSFFFYCCCCFCDCHALFTVMSCTLDCHALVTVMHFLLKTEDFVQNRLPILHFWLQTSLKSLRLRKLLD